MPQTDTTFAQFFQSHPSVMLVISLEEGDILDANESAIEFYGYTRDNLIGKKVETLNTRLDPELRFELMQDVRRGQLRSIQFIHRLFSGEERHVQVDTSPIVWKGTEALLSTIHDITEARRDKQALKRGADMFRALIEHSSNMVMLAEEDGVLNFLSPAVHEVLGFAPDELTGTSLVALIHPDDTSKYNQYWNNIVNANQGDVREIHLRVARKGQRYKWRTLSFRSSNMLDVENIQSVVINSHDITESEKLEASMRRYAKQLQDTNRELEEFTYVASHDLQEPLRKIISFGDRLIRNNADLDDKSKDYIDRMTDAAQRMSTLIHDLLAYTRLTTQESPVARVDLNKILEGVLSDLEIAMREKDAELEIDPLPTIDVDPTRMRQLFQNLIGNALKFSKEDVRPEIQITQRILPAKEMQRHHYSEDCDWLELTIEDNGIGFEQKYAQTIFQPFSRLHGRRAYKGTGIGLAICRKIVDQHHGKIFAFSSPGDGTTFQILMPMLQPPQTSPSGVVCTPEEQAVLAQMLENLDTAQGR